MTIAIHHLNSGSNIICNHSPLLFLRTSCLSSSSSVLRVLMSWLLLSLASPPPPPVPPPEPGAGAGAGQCGSGDTRSCTAHGVVRGQGRVSGAQCSASAHPVPDEAEHHVVERGPVHVDIVQQLPQRHALVAVVAVLPAAPTLSTPTAEQITIQIINNVNIKHTLPILFHRIYGLFTMLCSWSRPDGGRYGEPLGGEVVPEAG